MFLIQEVVYIYVLVKTKDQANNHMERITIKNFAGIDDLEISLNRINVFIGKQASGKSITAKLIYFFKGVSREFLDSALNEKTKTQAEKRLLSKFEEYFPTDTWPIKNFDITYHFDEHFIRVKKEKSKLKIEFSETVNKLFTYCKRIIKSDKGRFHPEDKFEIYRPSFKVHEKYMSIVEKELGNNASFNPLFIPAGRSFFANLQSSIFSFLSNNKAIDPFLVEFGSFYENIKPMALRSPAGRDDKHIFTMADNLIYEIIGGKYHREKNKDYLIHADRRKINVSFSSSGQQETLPLLLILKSLLRISFIGSGSSIFIEEPEAHLFPATQKKVIELMGLIFNNSKTASQLIITTHSPYVLTSLNNLIQASIISKSSQESLKERIYSIVPKEEIIDETFLNAFAFLDGKAESIVDKETGLIYSKYLDNVSEEIAVQFDHLLNIN